MNYSSYYQAQVPPQEAWFLVAILRSFEHLSFDRTLDKATSVFEFFVPTEMEPIFEEIMHAFLKQSVITTFIKLPNRLLNPAEGV